MLLPSHSGLGVCLSGTEGGGKQARMQLIVNGDPYPEAQTGWSVADLLSHLELEPGKVAVELNRDIVPKTGYADQALNDGDELEILHFVGGGADTTEEQS